jgi:hypothetical protein
MTGATADGPADLLAAARMMLAGHTNDGAGVWPRAVAFLTRQALELAVAELWRQRGLDMGHVSAHAQFLCLGEYADDPRLAGDAGFAWWALSRACHHHPYELAATASELRRWIDTVDEFTHRIASVEVDP